MRVALDRVADAASLYLVEVPPGGVAKTYSCDPLQVDGHINLHFDVEGRLLEVEVIPASKILPEEVINNAQIID
jgi:uncharacterized protein YuzE